MSRRLPGAMLALSLAATPAGAEEVVQVVIDKYRFEPREVTVRPGTVVEWLNAEKRTSHSIIVEGQPESERLFPDEVHRQRFDRPGRFPYRCGPHPEMVGAVVVR
ncbi:MAG: cupredoxin domain-containing protein [Magnetospirillum sp.]|nr:cupredoxin domain-containing protein [Magnetospirillum sp.]